MELLRRYWSMAFRYAPVAIQVDEHSLDWLPELAPFLRSDAFAFSIVQNATDVEFLPEATAATAAARIPHRVVTPDEVYGDSVASATSNTQGIVFRQGGPAFPQTPRSILSYVDADLVAAYCQSTALEESEDPAGRNIESIAVWELEKTLLWNTGVRKPNVFGRVQPLVSTPKPLELLSEMSANATGETSQT